MRRKQAGNMMKIPQTKISDADLFYPLTLTSSGWRTSVLWGYINRDGVAKQIVIISEMASICPDPGTLIHSWQTSLSDHRFLPMD